ncbi:MAG TPA: OmpA family protein [Gemmatimonadales bacterium]|nr:OmpA family protein [Gemmatimonadales bacterium]
MPRSSAVLAFFLFAGTEVLGAQTPGSFEITGFGRYSFFDDTLGLDDKIGGGGSLGFFFLKNLAIEAEAATTTTDGPAGLSVSNTPVRGRLTYHIPLGGNATSIRIGAGYVRDMYGKDADTDEDGITGVLGLRLGLSEKFGVKFDGTIDYVPSPSAGTFDNYMNLGVQAGLSLLLGNSYDKDKDGVKDKADRCPGTPTGEAVDGGGCGPSQRDTDNDKVKDAADRCPNTPAGQVADSQGCSAEQKDADQDRVSDSQDRCKGTPAGEKVDPEGCSESQKDDDKDAVMNVADRCPNTASGEKVDQNGCAPAQLDADADGVADASDQCPNSVAGESVDARGCGRDADGDKVADVADRCPNTPNGQAVDENGCPILFQQGARTVTLQGVTFATGKATLTPESEAVLVDVAKQLQASPEVRVQVAGFTDNSGSRAANVRLSQSRAVAVEKFLEQNGVSPAQLTAKGFGPDRPIASNKTAAGRAKNRRVELIRME